MTATVLIGLMPIPSLLLSAVFAACPVQSEMEVTVFNKSMMEFISKKTHPMFGCNNYKRVVAVSRHTWWDTDDGLGFRTQQWLGLMRCGARTVYDTSLIAGPANEQIKTVYLDNASNIPAGNITAAGWMAILHYVQEYGSLHNWLPAVYNSRNRTVVV